MITGFRENLSRELVVTMRRQLNWVFTAVEEITYRAGRLACRFLDRHGRSCRGRLDHDWVDGRWQVRR
jgi:hypothetical protein